VTELISDFYFLLRLNYPESALLAGRATRWALLKAEECGE
jgi:hypothetical protein